MSFKVGDIVRVKDYKDIDCSTFVPSMKCYCGHKYIITEITLYSDCSAYRLNCGADFIFEEECLEKVVASFVPGNKNYTFTFNAKKENKEMRKQEVGLTQRERIETEKEMYTEKSGVKEVNVIVLDKVVEVMFDENFPPSSYWLSYCSKEKIKTVCDDEDKFSLERALYIAFAKKMYSDMYTLEGIERKADELSYMKSYIKCVKNAMKVYECQQKLEALDREEKAIKKRQHEKRMEQKARRLARKIETRKNEQIAVQKEAYLQAMREFEEKKVKEYKNRTKKKNVKKEKKSC